MIKNYTNSKRQIMITQPYPSFIDPKVGGRAKPVSNGTIFIGKDKKDQIQFPEKVYYTDSNGTEIEMALPIHLNSAGVTVASKNSPDVVVRPYTKSASYSILIKNSNDNPVYINDSVSGFASGQDVANAAGYPWVEGEVSAKDRIYNYKPSDGSAIKVYDPVGGNLLGAKPDFVKFRRFGVKRGVYFAADYVTNVDSVNPSELNGISDSFMADGVSDVEIYMDGLTFTQSGTCISSTANLNSIKIHPCSVKDVTDYDALPNFSFLRVLDVENVDHITIEGVSAQSNLTSVTPDGEKKGFSWCRSKNGKTFNYSGKLIKGYRAHEVYTTGIVNSDSVNDQCRYGPTVQKGCNQIDIKATNNGCRRDFYIYAGEKTTGKMSVSGENTYGFSPLRLDVESNDEKLSFKSLDVSYTLNSSLTIASDSRQSPVRVAFVTASDEITGKAVVNDVKINLYGEFSDRRTIVDITKTIGETTGDTKGRGYEINGLHYGGDVVSSADGNHRLFNFDDGVNWHAGDFINNLTVDGLSVELPNATQLVLNTEMVEDAISVKSGLKLKNLNWEKAVIVRQPGEKVLFDNCDFKSITTKDAIPGCLRALNKVVNYAPESNTIDIANVDNNRSVTALLIDVSAKTGAAGPSLWYQAKLAGYVYYDASSTPTTRVEFNVLYENPASSVNPTLTANSNGKLTLALPEMTGLDNLSMNLQMFYDQTTDEEFSPIGTVSKQYEILV